MGAVTKFYQLFEFIPSPGEFEAVHDIATSGEGDGKRASRVEELVEKWRQNPNYEYELHDDDALEIVRDLFRRDVFGPGTDTPQGGFLAAVTQAKGGFEALQDALSSGTEARRRAQVVELSKKWGAPLTTDEANWFFTEYRHLSEDHDMVS